MKLTDAQIQKVESFLKQKIKGTCPYCHSNLDGKQKYSFQLLSLDKDYVLNESTLKVNLVACVCTNCKNVSLFSFDAIMMD